MRRVYLAGPPHADEYRRRAVALVHQIGWQPVDPMRRDFRGRTHGNEAEIVESDLAEIESEAYKRVQEIRGTSDARATEIYARAYNQTPESRDLYEFVKTMETYKKVIGQDSTLVLSTGSDLFRFLKAASGVKPAK